MAIFLKSQFRGKGGEENTVSVFSANLNEKETILRRKGNGLSPADYDELIETAKGYMSRLDTPSKKAGLRSKIADYQKAKDETAVFNLPELNAVTDDDYNKAMTSELIASPADFVGTRINSLKSQINKIDEKLLDSDYAVTHPRNAAISSERMRLETEINAWQLALDSYNGGNKTALRGWIYTDPKTGQPLIAEYAPSSFSNPINSKVWEGKKLISSKKTIKGVPMALVGSLAKDRYQANFFGEILDVNKDFADFGFTKGEGEPQGEIEVRPHIPIGGFGLGTDKQTLYKNEDGETYVKYLNTSLDKLGQLDSPVIPLPQVWQQRLNNNVVSVIDGEKLQTPSSLRVQMVSPQSFQTPILQGGGEAVPAVKPVSSEPTSLRQPEGQELAQKRTEEITGGSLFKSLVSTGKRLLGI